MEAKEPEILSVMPSDRQQGGEQNFQFKEQSTKLDSAEQSLLWTLLQDASPACPTPSPAACPPPSPVTCVPQALLHVSLQALLRVSLQTLLCVPHQVPLLRSLNILLPSFRRWMSSC